MRKQYGRGLLSGSDLPYTPAISLSLILVSVGVVLLVVNAVVQTLTSTQRKQLGYAAAALMVIGILVFMFA